jgi:AcrR family transcriptional regulator
MTLAAPSVSDAEADRRDLILTAAERAFARHGFHGANMQTVAAEAQMSAGNLYRYFKSKEAIVSGLTARDQAALASDFQELASTPDLLAGLGRMLRKHLVDEPVWRSQLLIEIWAEAARNPSIATMCAAIDDDVENHLSALIVAAQAASPHLRGGHPGFVVRLMDTVVAGLFKRRATEPDFDGDAEIALALGAFRAALDGSLKPYTLLEKATCP